MNHISNIDYTSNFSNFRTASPTNTGLESTTNSQRFSPRLFDTILDESFDKIFASLAATTEAVLLERAAAAEEAKLLKLTTKLAKQADKLKERQAKKAKINN